MPEERARAIGASAEKNPTHFFALKSSRQEQGNCAHSVKGVKAEKLKEVKQTYEDFQPFVQDAVLTGNTC